MILKTITAPAIEPLTLVEAKLNLRVDGSDEDTLITSLITVAREWCENWQHRAYITQTLQLTLDHFPHRHAQPWLWEDAFLFGYESRERHHHRHSNLIKLPRPPLQTLTSITYTDDTGVSTVMDPSTYIVDAASEPARIVPIADTDWPVVQLQPIAGIQIVYVAGYGDAESSVPARVKQAMQLLIAHWYNNREAVGNVGGEVEFAVRALLAQEQVVNT